MRNPLAARVAQSEASRTMAASQRAQDLRAQGVDVISLTVGEPDFPTPDHIKQAAKVALDEDFTHYTPSAGIPELRRAIAERSQRENRIPADAAHTLVTPTKQGLFMSLMALLEPGDEVLIPDPSFVSYVPQARLMGAVPVPVPLSKENEFGLDADTLASLVSNKTKLLMLCSPSNPTGMMDSPQAVKAAVDLANDHDFWILSDEIYDRIVYEGRVVSPASLPGGAERTITLNGFSKAYAMTGWRVGWLHAPDPVFGGIAKIQTQSITHVTSICQKAALAALQGPQGDVDRMVAAFRRRRDLVVEEIDKTPGLSMATPKGAFYAWPRFDFDVDADAFAEFLLDKAHVAVVSGLAFGQQGRKYVRVSYAAPDASLHSAFERIRVALETAPEMTQNPRSS